MARSGLLFLLLISSFSGITQINEKLIDSAFACIDANNYGKAINIYTSILASDPQNARVYELRGLAYQEMKDHESAMRDYSHSVAAAPTYWLGYLRRADLLAKMEYYNDALKDYSMALKHADSTTSREIVLVNRGQIKRRLNDINGAVEDLRKAAEYNPASIAALVGLGSLLPAIGKPQEGIKYLEKVIELDSTFEGGHGNLAFLYSELGEYSKALDISNKLLAFKPKEGIALNNRGFIKYKLNDFSGALEDINNSILLLPGNSYAFKNRGLVYIAMNRKADACIDLIKALSLGFSEEYGNEVQELIDKHCTPGKEAIKAL